MEQWELQIQGFPAAPDPRVFTKALHAASNVLKTDLADFETERLFHTLMLAPVNLLRTVLSHYTEEDWSNSVIEAFKLLCSVAGKYRDPLEPYFENVVKLCHLHHTAHVRRVALLCLAEIARVTPHGATNAQRFATELQSATSCNTELALLVGTLCEYHPEVLENQETRIWRTYLSSLGCNGLTDKFLSSVFQGISGLLVSFGRNLPVNELWDFYDTMVRHSARCKNVCMTILRLHSSLFKEKIANDVNTRAMLWSIATENGVAEALIGVYDAVADVKGHNFKVIIEQEVLPQLSTANKLPALHLLTALRGRGFDFDLESCVDVQNLEFELRSAGVTYYVADLIIWYIRSGLAHSLRLSQTALLFYRNLPSKKLNGLAAAILSQEKVRVESISFLASESSQPGADSDYMPIWRAMLVEAGTADQRSDALQDFIDYVTSVLENWREEGGEVLPEKIASLLNVTTDILSLPVEDAAYDLLSLAVGDARRQCRAAETLAVAAAVLARGGTLADDVWTDVRVERCRDEAALCACCLLLLQAPYHVDAHNILRALQIIFTRHDVEDVTLLKAVKKLENLLTEADMDLEAEFQKAICLVRKLQSRKVVDKDSRILQRHITMFLGKYGGKTDHNNNENEVRIVAAKLKDSLFLSIPHLETERVKINLQEIVQLAIEQEDPEALQQLLKIICANLNSRRDPATLSALSLCCRALCRDICRGATSDASRGVVQRALMYCDTPLAVHDLLSFISEEQSPGVRQLLCSCLPAILSDELLASTVSRAADMMRGSGMTKRAGMDIIDALLPSLEDNHALIKSLLPQVLEQIAKTNTLEAMSTLEKATKLYLDKLALYDITYVDNLMRRLIRILIIGPKVEKYNVDTYRKTVNIIIQIAKAVTDAGKTQYSRVVEMIFNVIDLDEKYLFKGLYVLAVLRNNFDSQSSYSSSLFLDKTLLKELYDVDIQYSEDYDFQLEAILIFLKEYAATLLEYSYEKTVKLLASIVLDAPPQSVVNHGHRLINCLSTYKSILKSFPKALEESFEDSVSRLPLRNFIDSSHSVTIKAMNVYLDVSGSYLNGLMDALVTWPKQILRKYVEGTSGTALLYLTDCLTAAVKVPSFNVKSLLLEGRAANEFVGVKFCAKFMKVLLKSFLKKPYVLLDDDVGECCVVLDDVVKFCIQRKCSEKVNEEVLDLVDAVWPTYASRTTFQQKCDLLSNVSCLPKSLPRESNPMRWVAAQLNNSASREDCTRLVGVLPGGDEFAECYTAFAQRCLSARLCDCAGAAVRAALDALSAKPCAALLGIIAKLAATDENKPQEQDKWWVKAMDSCCASLARHETFKACDTLLRISDDSLTLGVCTRLMLPLLRYSTATYCEEFFSRNLKTMLDCLTRKPRDTRASKYHQCIVERTRALLLLQVAFEKIPLSNLQSPQSVLYRELNLVSPTSNHLTSTMCKLCVTLRREDCPKDAAEGFSESFRQYQCAIYNCLCAAICKSKPADKFYDHIVGWTAWGRVTSDSDIYHLPVQRRRRKTLQPVSIPTNSTAGSPSTLTKTRTRTKMFLRTLSEDPHKFDLYNQETEEVEIQELQMSDSEINRHMCAGTLTALLAHTSELSCWKGVCEQLTHTLASKHSYLLAQCVCNCHEALAPHANELRPALLAFIANTLQNGRLNGLHVDILETLIHWRDNPTLPASSQKDLQSTIEALIKEAIATKDTFLQLLDSFLEIYSKFVSVDWSVFSQHIRDHEWRCLPVIQKLTKHKIRIPELVPALFQVDLKHWLQDIKIAEIFGAALSCESESEEATQSFKNMLKRVKQSDSYVKMLYYAQIGCKSICDEANFRQVTDQTRKLPKSLQNKCLQILSTYVSQQDRPTDYITSMFETIELSEFLTTDNVDALGVVAKGLRLMDERLKRRVVIQALEYCSHSSGKVKKAAFSVAAAAFQELFPTESPEEPSSKRRRKQMTLLTILDENDHYILTVVSRVAEGVTSYNVDVIDAVKAVLKKGAGERLAECFSLLLAGGTPEQSVCALLHLFYAELKSNESFLACKLRDEPLDLIEPKGTSKLFTDTKSCRGTLLSYRVTGPRHRTKLTDTPAAEIDVQVSIDSILDSLLQFAKREPRAALALALQTVRSLSGRGFDSRSALATLVAAKMVTPSDATPLYVQLGRAVIDKAVTSQKFVEAVSRLKEKASLSDDEELVKCLYEELMLRKDISIFELRSAPMPELQMEEIMRRFSLQDLASCFGRLANWDELTLQQRATQKVGLPALWTDEDSFKAALDNFKDTALGNTTLSWFDKLVSSYYEDTKDSARWLLDARKWPKRRFHESAVAEALSWELDAEPWSCEMSPKDCLVEWSARLMIRAAQASEREATYPSHANELVWCVRANEMGIHRGVLLCCQRNEIVDLPEEDKISWQHQKLLALNGMALERNDSGLLREPLDTAVNLVSKYDVTPDSVGIYKLYLERNISNLTSKEIEGMFEKVNKPIEKSSFMKSKSTLTSLYEMALLHFHQQWTDDQTKQNDVIANLAFALYRMRESNLGPSDQHVALLLNKLYEYSGSSIDDDDVINKILQVFYPKQQYFDDFTTEQIHGIRHLLGMHPPENKSKRDYRKMFSTIRDVGHCLFKYCEGLVKAVKKKDQWIEIFERIKEMFENPFAGSDYQLLTAQKDKLYAVADFDSSITETKLEVLRSVMVSLDQPPKTILRVSQLCPSLMTNTDELKRLLPRGDVVRVEDQVTVITNSIRRPCIITVLTSLGPRVRFVHKAGESLLRDASVVRLRPGAGYKVIPTSADSGLMDYLEHHETLYSLISSVCNLDEISASVQRPFDEELIVTPSPHTFKQLREKVPVHALRTAMERNSSCFEDFLMKKKNFQDSLATTAVFNWILGLGDRHLENFMCSVVSGRLVSIDMGAALRFASELPPARLTPCLLAMADSTVLEARLQSALAHFRGSAQMFCNFARMTFSWSAAEIEDKLPYIQALVTGKRLSHHVTRDIIEKSHWTYKEAYLNLIDEVFTEFEDKDQYTIVEQVSCFLLHCTSQRILLVTRAGWTPWV